MKEKLYCKNLTELIREVLAEQDTLWLENEIESLDVSVGDDE